MVWYVHKDLCDSPSLPVGGYLTLIRVSVRLRASAKLASRAQTANIAGPPDQSHDLSHGRRFCNGDYPECAEEGSNEMNQVTQMATETTQAIQASLGFIGD